MVSFVWMSQDMSNRHLLSNDRRWDLDIVQNPQIGLALDLRDATVVSVIVASECKAINVVNLLG